MKKLTIKGLEHVTLFDSIDKLKESYKDTKLDRVSNGRLKVGSTYQVKGFTHSDAVTQGTGSKAREIKAWDGVMLQDVESKKQFPVSVSTLTGTGFQKNEDESYTLQRTSVTIFDDATDIKKNAKIRVDAIEKLTVTGFEQSAGETMEKNFYLLSKVTN